MEQLLARFTEPDADPADLFARLIDEIRPRRADDVEAARRTLQALCFILGGHPELRAGLRNALLALQQNCRHAELYTSTGILPNTGFFSEIFRRIGHKCLPEVLDPELLRSFLRRVFRRPSDRHWMIGMFKQGHIQNCVAVRHIHAVNAESTQDLLDLLFIRH